MHVFHEWVSQRNRHTKENYPADLLDKPYSTQIISECLQRFVAEDRRANGTCYPLRTLFQLLSGLLQHSREIQPNPPNFLDQSDTHFKELYGASDATFRNLHEQAIEMSKKSTEIITKEAEYML